MGAVEEARHSGQSRHDDLDQRQDLELEAAGLNNASHATLIPFPGYPGGLRSSFGFAPAGRGAPLGGGALRSSAGAARRTSGAAAAVPLGRHAVPPGPRVAVPLGRHAVPPGPRAAVPLGRHAVPLAPRAAVALGRLRAAPLGRRPHLDSEERCDLLPPAPHDGSEPPPWLVPLHDR